MGDRGNIVVRQSDSPSDDVWFYTHWSGSEIKETVQSALARQQRWDDPPYLARIIFCELVKGNEADEAGFGISTRLQDNEHPILFVDIPNKVVGTIAEDKLENHRLPAKLPKGKSFEDFAKAKQEVSP